MSQKKSAAHIVNGDDANVALRQSEREFGVLVSAVEDYAIFLLSPEGNVIRLEASFRILISRSGETYSTCTSGPSIDQVAS
jgi:hypothetical protein